ncbi:uncharacterized protein BYT42DRAFT_62213 [Radiomyces spectabilis]|uniref:uncharacterized protein n=1 Tax=Radiomyces spectabilis TaxID=64574 RepID=UPI00221E75B9|nr:uncharacterized protein BYT42DRAFT_62213 [Radiomyces spectabilis]KAI8373215.1 hypothetical protein BYT42DRAFT_62213 [Radiomyces spectabilis]
MERSFTFTALLLLLNLSFSLAFYGNRDAVVELTPKNFREVVLKTNQLAAVEFYAPWCGHCQRLAPEWKKAANNLKGLATVAAVNCDDEKNRPLCGEYGIQGFPTIKIFRTDRNKKSGARTRKPTDYQGPRDAKAIVDHLLSIQPSNVRFIKQDASKVKSQRSIHIDDFLANQNETLPKALLFTDKSTTTPLYKALSVEFGDDRMLFGEIKKTEKSILDTYSIKAFPTLLVITSQNEPVIYKGALKYEALRQFLEQHALSKKDTKSASAAKATAEQQQVTVQELNSDKEMEQHCSSSANVICVIAVVPTDEKEKADTVELLKELSAASSQRFHFGWILEDRSASVVGKLDLVRDFPTLFIVHTNKQLYRPYVGAWNKQNIMQWLDQIASGRTQAWSYQGSLKIDASKQWRDEL